jgi:dual specificity tyrosine-phosphorylation-regulated kinase 2/3/4
MLQYIHYKRIVHCDLKPENVLFKWKNKSIVKVIDFGTACEEGDCAFNYIQSRYYRAPEIILGMKYDRAIDMWSLGCIVAELFTGEALF